MLKILFQNEYYKHKGNTLFWLVLLLPLLWVFVIFLFVFSLSYEDFEMRVNSTHGNLDPYAYFFGWLNKLVAILLLFYYAFLAIILVDVEKQAKSWKYYLTLPLKAIHFWWVKCILLFFMSFVGLLSLACFTILANSILAFFKPDFPYHEYPSDEFVILLSMLRTWLDSFVAFPIILFLTLWLKNYGILMLLTLIVTILLHLVFLSLGELESYDELRILKGIRFRHFLRKLDIFLALEGLILTFMLSFGVKYIIK